MQRKRIIFALGICRRNSSSTLYSRHHPCRLCQQLIENHQSFDETVILGLQPRHFLADIIHKKLEKLIKSIPSGISMLLFIAMTSEGGKSL